MRRSADTAPNRRSGRRLAPTRCPCLCDGSKVFFLTKFEEVIDRLEHAVPQVVFAGLELGCTFATDLSRGSIALRSAYGLIDQILLPAGDVRPLMNQK